MGYKAFILFYLVLTETFIELMIKAMDMEILDWHEITSWKAGKTALLCGILIYHAFYRWTPFVAVAKFKNTEDGENFRTTLKTSRIPWFFFANIFHCLLLLIFAFVILKLNHAAWPLYSVLFIGAAELILYLIIGKQLKLFSIVMGKNSLILSRGYLTIIPLKDLKSIEKKYGDEIYFTMKNGHVHTLNFGIFEEKKLTEFLIKLKNNAEVHDVYFGNDLKS